MLIFKWLQRNLLVLMLALAIVSPLTYVHDASAQSSQAASADTPQPPPMPAQKIEVENPYGLGAMIKQGDIVAKATLLILVIMSVMTWYVLYTKFNEQKKVLLVSQAALESVDTAKELGSVISSLPEDNAYTYIAKIIDGAAKDREGKVGSELDNYSWQGFASQKAVEVVQNRMQDGLTILATVGSTAPFVGLFGTVWGIYHALTAIGVSGQASIDKVAGPVGEALIMTAIGLAVAVPAVLIYNWLVRRNKLVAENIKLFANGANLIVMRQAGRK